jgi:RHS repeat-associated protein
VAIIEKNSGGTVTSTKQYVWLGNSMAEERDATGVNVTKRFFAQGEQIAGASYYYTRDHLGSVREMLNSSGTIVARYSYDPYGRATLIQGTNLADFQYAGYYEHQTSGLNLTWFRAYDANTGRWLSRDPSPDAEENLGPNLYEYVDNDPENEMDPLGLASGKGNPGCPCHYHPVPLWKALGYLSLRSATASIFAQANSGVAQALLVAAASSSALGNTPGVSKTLQTAAKAGAAYTFYGVAAGEILFYLYLLSHLASPVCIHD